MKAPYLICYTANRGAGKVLFVDPFVGDDVNDGLYWGAHAKETIGSAITAGAVEIFIQNTGARRIACGNISPGDGHNDNQKEIRIIGNNDSNNKARLPIVMNGKIYNSTEFTGLAPGKTYTFKADLSGDVPGASDDCFVADPHLITLAAGEGGKVRLTKQVSIDNTEANPGSFFYDATGGSEALYVHLPDSSLTYFSNGGEIAYQLAYIGASVNKGNIIHLENLVVWGQVRSMQGGRIFMSNIEQRYSKDQGIFIEQGGTIVGDIIKCYYNYTDGVSAKGVGRASLSNIEIGHVGTANIDQCLTAHETSVIDAEDVSLFDSAGQLVAAVDGSTINLKNFHLRDAGSDGLHFEGGCGGILHNGVVRNCARGLIGGANQDWRQGSLIWAKDVFFTGNSGYDLSVPVGSDSDVIIEDCRYTSIDPGNNNFTAIKSKRYPVALGT